MSAPHSCADCGRPIRRRRLCGRCSYTASRGRELRAEGLNRNAIAADLDRWLKEAQP